MASVAAGRAERALGERGAVLVESALVLLLVLTILFGIIEWGLYFKNSLTATSATRTGVRTASALPRAGVGPAPDFTPVFASDTAAAVEAAMAALDDDSPEVLWIYKADADGLPDSGNFTSCTTCIRYTWDAPSETWVNPTGSWPPSTQSACGGDESDSVGVYLKARHDFISGFFGSSRTMEDHTVMRFEPVRGQCKP